MSRVEDIKRRIVGQWRLVSYETREPDGRRGRPYADAVGRIDYSERGHMSGQVMRPGRRREEAAAGYIAYFGTYEIAPDGKSITHHVEGALHPAWVGGDQRRAMTFDGDRLVLSAAVERAGQTVTHVITWEKL